MDGKQVEEEAKYEEDRLEVTWAKTRDSGGATSEPAVSQRGETVAVKVFTMGRRIIQTHTLLRSWLTRRREPSRIKMGTLNTVKIL